MEETRTQIPLGEDQGLQNDCGCDGNCCPPKKNNIIAKILFAVIILLAIGIVAVKLYNHPAADSGKQTQCTPGATSCCDTTKKTTCDTTKGSSCCSKK